MTKRYEQALREFVRLADVFFIFVAFNLAFHIRRAEWFADTANRLLGDTLPLPLEQGFRQIENFDQILWFIVPLWLFLLSYFRTYEFERTGTFYATVKGVMKAHAVGALVIASFVFFSSLLDYRRTFFVLFILFCLALTLSVRYAVQFSLRAARTHGRNRNRVVIIGNGEKALRALVELTRHQYWGFAIDGIITEKPTTEEKLLGMKVLGSLADAERILRHTPVDDVFVAIDEGKYVELKEILRICENIGVTVHLLPDKYDLEIAKSTVGTLGEMEFVTFLTVVDNPAQRFAKRALDIAVSLMLLPVLAAAYVAAGIAIKLDSPGPVIYKCIRLTRNRRPFAFYKFRTMVNGAEEEFELVSRNNAMKGPIHKVPGDPRVTRVGRFLRKWSIDELPQIVNVLMGDMSLVGPRPPLPEEVDLYTLPQLRKLSMQQGITGLWQVSGRDNVVRFEDRLRMDLQYIDNWSLWLDIKILLKTFFTVFRGAL